MGKGLTRWFTGPLRARTTAVAVFVVAVSLSIASVTLIYLLRQELESSVRDNVATRTGDIATLIREDRLPVQLAFQEEDAALVQVVGDTGNVLASTPNIVDQPRISTVTPTSSTPRWFRLNNLPVDRGARFVVVAQRSAGPRGFVTIYAAASLDAADAAVRTLTTTLAVGVPLLILLVGLTTWSLTGITLRPVERMRVQVNDISARDLHRRLLVPSSDDEIRRLAVTMNEMLDRLERSSDRQQQFVADASHELRSPLTVMRTIVEVNLAHPNHADWVATSEELLTFQSRVERLVDDLLTLAKIDSGTRTRPFQRVDLAALVTKETGRRLPRDGVSLTANAPPHPIFVLGDSDHLVQILGNLLDNAERHASANVSVRVDATHEEARLRVIDDGAGIAAADRTRVFERFTRLDKARSRGQGGSGLGLAIVKDLLRSHHGTVEIVEVDAQTCFEVRLPLDRATDGGAISTRSSKRLDVEHTMS